MRARRRARRRLAGSTRWSTGSYRGTCVAGGGIHEIDRSNDARSQEPATAERPFQQVGRSRRSRVWRRRNIGDDRSMIQGLAIGVLTAGLLLGAWTGIQAYRRRPTTDAQMVGAIVLEAALLAGTALAAAVPPLTAVVAVLA